MGGSWVLEWQIDKRQCEAAAAAATEPAAAAPTGQAHRQRCGACPAALPGYFSFISALRRARRPSVDSIAAMKMGSSSRPRSATCSFSSAGVMASKSTTRPPPGRSTSIALPRSVRLERTWFQEGLQGGDRGGGDRGGGRGFDGGAGGGGIGIDASVRNKEYAKGQSGKASGGKPDALHLPRRLVTCWVCPRVDNTSD